MGNAHKTGDSLHKNSRPVVASSDANKATLIIDPKSAMGRIAPPYDMIIPPSTSIACPVR